MSFASSVFAIEVENSRISKPSTPEAVAFSFADAGLCGKGNLNFDRICKKRDAFCAQNLLVCSPDYDSSLDQEKNWKSAYANIRKVYDDARKDEAILKKCCQDDQECRRIMSNEIKIEIVEELPVPANFTHGEKKIRMKKAFWMFSQGSINDIFLHEFGHACQSARRPSVSSGWRKSSVFTVETAEEDLKKLFPSEVHTCLKERSKYWVTSSFFVEAKLNEIFADFIFSEFRRGPLEFNWACLEGGDEKHVSANIYMDCLLTNPEYKQKFEQRYCEGILQTTSKVPPRPRVESKPPAPISAKGRR